MVKDILLVSAALIIAVVLIKKKMNIGIVMIIESILVALIADIDLSGYADIMFRSVTSVSTIKLVIIFILIMMLENILRKTGMLKDIVTSLKALVGSNRAVAGMLPLVVGLLPSPGGARFSCPMVDEIASEHSTGENLTFVNYWFRHTWMDGFLLYPGIILAAQLLEISVLDFFIRLLPFMIFTGIVGYFTGLRKIKKERSGSVKQKRENIYIFIRSISPVITVIIIYILLLDVTAYALEFSLASVCIGLLLIKKFTIRNIFVTLKRSFPAKLILMIFGVMIFRDTLFGSGLLEGLPSVLSDAGIPVYAAFLLLPFATGASTGICVSYISISFPILLTIGLNDNLWYGVLAFVAGYIGVMITPVHLCMVVTSEYFKNSISNLVKKVFISEIPLMIIVTVTMILLFSR